MHTSTFVTLFVRHCYNIKTKEYKLNKADPVRSGSFFCPHSITIQKLAGQLQCSITFGVSNVFELPTIQLALIPIRLGNNATEVEEL